MENSQDLSDNFKFFALRMAANYEIHKKKEVDKYINNIVIKKHQIEQQLDYNIYGSKPTIIM